MGVFGKKTRNFGQKWPKLAEPEFSQYVHEVIPVEDPKCSFYNKNWGKRARRLGEIGQNGQILGKNGQKIKNENFWAKTEMTQFEPLWMHNFMQEIRKIERAVLAADSGRTDGRTYESEFIGSNPVNRGTNKKVPLC